MAVAAVVGSPSGAINYTFTTDSIGDWASVANGTYFYDKADKLVHFKDDSGAILELFTASGGGGLQGVHALVKLTTSLSINASLNSAGLPSMGTLANRLYANPFIPNQTFTSSSLYINATSAVAGALVKILIYSNLDGIPNSLLFESADLDCSTIGQKTAITSFTFNAGTTYWLTVFSSSASNLTGLSINSLITIKVIVNQQTVGYSANITYGAAPITYPVSLISNTSTIPCVFITAA